MVQKVFAEKPVVVLLQPFCGPLYNDVTTAIRSLYRLQRFLLLKSGHGPKEVNDVARICAFDGDVGGGDAVVWGWGGLMSAIVGERDEPRETHNFAPRRC
jgi:hypothetical protein